jgi:hypothetical protein
MSTIFVPEIFANAVNEELGVHLRLGRLAFDASSAVSEIRNAGDTIVFPQLDRVVQIGEVLKGDSVTPDVINMSKMEAKIKLTGGGARIFDSERIQIKGSVLNLMVTQVAEAMALDIERDLGKAIHEDAMYKIALGSGGVTVTALEACINLFRDNVNTSSFAGIVINSVYNSGFYEMPAFTSAEKTYTTANSGIVVNNVIGYYRGIPVVSTDAATYNESEEPCIYILKKRALGYVFQRNILIEEEREAKLFATDIIVSALYATKLLDQKGVVVLAPTV